jgi:hypothetical protein
MDNELCHKPRASITGTLRRSQANLKPNSQLFYISQISDALYFKQGLGMPWKVGHIEILERLIRDISVMIIPSNQSSILHCSLTECID